GRPGGPVPGGETRIVHHRVGRDRRASARSATGGGVAGGVARGAAGAVAARTAGRPGRARVPAAVRPHRLGPAGRPPAAAGRRRPLTWTERRPRSASADARLGRLPRPAVAGGAVDGEGLGPPYQLAQFGQAADLAVGAGLDQRGAPRPI